MYEDIHNWQPLSVAEVGNLLSGLPVPWWIAGGWAIDLFLGRQTRPHGDTDVLIRRDDQLAVQQYLSHWDLYKTGQPGLKPWPAGEFLLPPVNDIWCRRDAQAPWCLQFMLLDTRDDRWVFRRNPDITGPLDAIGRRTEAGIPYLAPEVQLLYKATPEPRDKDHADFVLAAPLLDEAARVWLLKCLERQYPYGHAWIEALRRIERGITS